MHSRVKRLVVPVYLITSSCLVPFPVLNCHQSMSAACSLDLYVVKDPIDTL